MIRNAQQVSKLIIDAQKKAGTTDLSGLAPAFTGRVQWPVHCTVGPGLEGAIACESEVSYVNGTHGALLYRGYDIFDLSAHSTFEETSYLLIHGRLPTEKQFERFKTKLASYRHVGPTLRLLMSFPVEEMSTMAALRLGTNLLRRRITGADFEEFKASTSDAIGTDEDSIPMETMPLGEEHAVYAFEKAARAKAKAKDQKHSREEETASYESCYHLLAATATIAAAISRIRQGLMPIEPDLSLGHAANYLYMLTGRRPTKTEERIMDVALILHADHGMNASMFASLVVASTLSDIYASIGSGVAALTGPLHGGANEEVIKTLKEIRSPENAAAWFKKARKHNKKIMGFGHRVYKTYDPRALVLGPLAKRITASDPTIDKLLKTAVALEQEVTAELGESKGIYPNVDFYSGLVYMALGIPTDMFTPTFAVARVAGWTARVLEYLEKNRLFRPRAIYTGSLDKKYVSMRRRRRAH